MTWRVGRKNPLNIYEGDHGDERDRSICQCHRPEDAARIVEAVNAAERYRDALERILREAQDNMAAAIAEDALEPTEWHPSGFLFKRRKGDR